MPFARRFMLLCTIFYLYAAVRCLAQSPLQPAALSCEYRSNPLGIDIHRPQLSWNFEATANDQVQSAYEIIVSASPAEIEHGRGTAWSTGRVNAGDNLNITYSGVPLRPFTRYYWRVKVYNGQGLPSAWSKTNWFETAMLAASDWQGKWIGDGRPQPPDAAAYLPDAMPLFRKTFATARQVASARLYVCGLGYYEASLNGEKVGTSLLDPGFTRFSKEVLYAVYDVMAALKKGNNTLGLMLGNGWWNPLPFKFFGRWDLRDYQQHGRPCVKANLRIRYTDGTIDLLATDESWQTDRGPVITNNVYLGETYDARLEQKNWNTTGQTAAPWKNAEIVTGPAGRLSSQQQPPVRITKTLVPVAVTEWKPGVFIADMGQNFAGVAAISVKGKPGTCITLRYGEALFPDGSLNGLTTAATQIKKGGITGGPGAPETMWQQDQYILNGTGTEHWHSRFTFHGFRYVEISGWPGTPTPNDITGLRMNTDLQENGTFHCSDSLFNRLHEVVNWTFLSNVFSVQSDCPGREKMGYGADIAVTANAYMYNFNMAAFYRKTVNDFANDQRDSGGITEIAPFTGITDKGYGDESGPIGWQLAFPYLQEQLYDIYGDKRTIEENYPAVKKQLAFLSRKAIDHLFYWGISDHEALDPKPEGLTSTAFYYQHALLAAKFAGILGHTADSVNYAGLALQIKKALVSRFLVPGTGRFDNGTESAQLFALWYGLSPEQEHTTAALYHEFERRDWHVSTGIFSTRMLFDVLRMRNDNETAFRIAHQPTYPGWINMLQHGATTLWERWGDAGTVYSMNHPMFGSIDEWFYRSILGINPAAPGFTRIIIKPQPAGTLTSASGSYLSVMGPVESAWQKNGKTFRLAVAIPPNSRAQIFLPAPANAVLTVNGKLQQPLRQEGGYAILETGSGKYVFLVN